MRRKIMAVRQNISGGADLWIAPLPSSPLPFRGRAFCGGRFFPCALGRSGIVSQARKCEGDGATPEGSFPLRHLFFRAGRFYPPPISQLPQNPILPLQQWCEDKNAPAYNRLYRPSHKNPHYKKGSLWRADPLFDVILVLGHNDNPPVSGKGSGIFLHAGSVGLGATRGCVGFFAQDLGWIARQLGKKSRIHILGKGIISGRIISPARQKSPRRGGYGSPPIRQPVHNHGSSPC